jgi:hypothetical protein
MRCPGARATSPEDGLDALVSASSSAGSAEPEHPTQKRTAETTVIATFRARREYSIGAAGPAHAPGVRML